MRPRSYVDGANTLGENIADNGGIRLAYDAASPFMATSHSIAGFTPQQQFFTAGAQTWCANTNMSASIAATTLEVNMVKQILPTLLRDGHLTRSALGVRIRDSRDLSLEDRKELKLGDEKGAVIESGRAPP